MYEEYGLDYPEKCNGVFAAAIWDANRQRLVLTRDHMGCKNIYYTETGHEIVFASTTAGLKASGKTGVELDKGAVHQYFSSTTVFHPDTIFKNIFCVRPGYSQVFEKNKSYGHRYWQVENITEDVSISFDDWKPRIRHLVLDAIKIRQMADERIGSVLSGGVDSSTISAVLTRETGKPLDVFSIAFDESRYNDSALQQVLLDCTKFRQHLAVLRPDNVPRLLDAVLTHLDSPVSNASAMGTYNCFNLAGGEVDVIFDGEAADELFCGGGGVLGDKQVGFFGLMPYPLRRRLFRLLGTSLYLETPGKISKFKRLFYRISLHEHERMLT